MIKTTIVTVCDFCGKEDIKTMDAETYNEYVIIPPENWKDTFNVKDFPYESKMACPSCIEHAKEQGWVEQ